MNKSDYESAGIIRVRYAECDAQGIVFNAHYLTYFDVAVTEYFRLKGHDYIPFVRESGLDFHVVRSLIDYKSPARFDDEVELLVRGEFKGPRLFWNIALLRGDDLLCSGELTYAVVKADTGRVTRIDEKFALSLGLAPRSS